MAPITTTSTSTSSATPTAADAESHFSGATILARIFAFDRITASVSAAVLTLGAIPVARLLDWPTWIVLAVGLGLIPYGWMLHTIVRDRNYNSGTARLSAAGDALWVAASVATIVLASDATSTIGAWIVAVQAMMVADSGIIKVIGWRRS